jgi:hypothetical protein
MRSVRGSDGHGVGRVLVTRPGGQAPGSCPGTFTVLHNDSVRPMAVPAGAYSVRTAGVSCATASRRGPRITRVIARRGLDLAPSLPEGSWRG